MSQMQSVRDLYIGLDLGRLLNDGGGVPTQEASPPDAIGIVQTQPAVLVVEAQRHIRQVISLYDMGVALGIIPLCPRLRRILAMAQVHLQWADKGSEAVVDGREPAGFYFPR